LTYKQTRKQLHNYTGPPTGSPPLDRSKEQITRLKRKGENNMYNYLEAMKNDIQEYINENINLEDYEDKDELEQYLNDELWTEDSVTGNASGSYTFNSYKAKENLEGNEDLVREMCREFGIDAETIADKFLNEEYEYFDVSVRCYLLGQAIAEVLEDIEI
jgi:hypothetical protein